MHDNPRHYQVTLQAANGKKIYLRWKEATFDKGDANFPDIMPKAFDKPYQPRREQNLQAGAARL
ncbi:MAG TPA: hypothetical protein PKW15_05935 [Alphaproteobacteria bacterium]|nr:hypothetical protein [Alphaproteobacteria bacterium]